MDEIENSFNGEEQTVERWAEEYRRLHYAIAARQLGLDTGKAWPTHDNDDGDWCHIELENLYWSLESLGAEWRVKQIERKNNAILAALKK